MLVAFSFPEREFKKIFEHVSSILKKNEVEYESQWPHVSILASDAIGLDSKDLIQKALLAKPSFKYLRWDILESGDKSRYFLVLILDAPKEYVDAYEFLKKTFNIQPRMGMLPHVSVVSFDKKYFNNVKEIMGEIENIDIMNGQAKAEYIQLWRMANPKMDKVPDFEFEIYGSKKRIKDIEDKGFEIVDAMEDEWEIGTMTESKKKKKKKRKTALAAFYGKGDGRSGATMPPFRAPTNGPTPRLGASLPSPVTGINAPQFGTMPAAPMVAWRDEIATLFESNFHVCLVCNGNRVMKNNVACPLCSQIDSSVQVSPFETCQDGGGVDNTNNFMGFDVPWDLR